MVIAVAWPTPASYPPIRQVLAPGASLRSSWPALGSTPRMTREGLVNLASTIRPHHGSTRWSMRPWASVCRPSPWRRALPRSHGPAEEKVDGQRLTFWLMPRGLTSLAQASEALAARPRPSRRSTGQPWVGSEEDGASAGTSVRARGRQGDAKRERARPGGMAPLAAWVKDAQSTPAAPVIDPLIRASSGADDLRRPVKANPAFAGLPSY
jgi:hypothetical protein